MRSVRVPLSTVERGEHELERDAAHYVVRVLRVAVGGELVGFDPERRVEARGRVARIEGGRAWVRFDEVTPTAARPGPRVTLIQGVGKGDKLDAVVRDATELGVARVLPAIAARSVARRDTDAALARLRRVAVEAARQAGRGDVPEIEAARPLPDVLAGIDCEVRLVLHPAAPGAGTAALRRGARARSIAIAVGPEGGFDDHELACAREHGFEVGALGPLVLRTETAATAALGALAALVDDPA